MDIVAIGCDEAAYSFKEEIREYLQNKGHELIDYGVYNTDPVLYPDIAGKVATAIINKEAKRGLLFCGTGIGMAITANKFPGIRAAQCHDTFSAERAALSNNAHIITMGARIIGIELAKKIVDRWLELEYVDSPSGKKIERIMDYDKAYRPL